MERKSLGKNPVPRFNGHGRPALLTRSSISSEPHRLLIMRRVAEWDYRGQGLCFVLEQGLCEKLVRIVSIHFGRS
ncbi:hypothetical protein [Oryza sativa Japonica Group]|uniref:Uncharacterized protein n=5 Tax=Oryza TaxID=4527 RepID=Q5JNJ7_ORYSJ|nr:hypothetical protein [Oryza sativa Japonica Group]